MSTSAVFNPTCSITSMEMAYPTWARFHLDFVCLFQGKNILVAVDTHSKWIEVVCTPSMSSSCVIEELRSLFAKFGLPEMVVTDNGTCFVSAEFEQFLRSNEGSNTLLRLPLTTLHLMAWQRGPFKWSRRA